MLLPFCCPDPPPFPFPPTVPLDRHFCRCLVPVDCHGSIDIPTLPTATATAPQTTCDASADTAEDTGAAADAADTVASCRGGGLCDLSAEPMLGLLGKNLTSLDLSRNHLTHLAGIERLSSSLQHLDVSRNLLTDLPSQLASLQHLVTLNLSRNRLRPRDFPGLVLLVHPSQPPSLVCLPLALAARPGLSHPYVACSV